jgi:3-oxoacyl-[acyl-carrier protein] reductase
MEINLLSKNALVGASSQGLGYAIAMQLAQCGANVTLMSRNEKKLRKAVLSLPKLHSSQLHNYLVVDFTDFPSFQNVITSYFDIHEIDILVNNTNGPPAGTALLQDINGYQSAFDLLFKIACTTTSLALASMIDKKYGRIINVSSVSVKEPVQNLVLSNSIRSAALAWAKTLAAEVAEYNITVNNILTGYFDTERINELINKEGIVKSMTHEEVRKLKTDEVPMKRFGRPEEYGHLAVFLASDYASYITGASIPIDGGLTKVY